MRSFRVWLIALALFAAGTVRPVDGSIVQTPPAPPIELWAMGSINQSSLTITPSPPGVNITAPAGTLTTTALLTQAGSTVPPLNNIGLNVTDTLTFAGGTFNPVNASLQYMPSPNLVTFTTPQGTFTYSGNFAAAGTLASFPFSAAQQTLLTYGTLTEASNAFAPTVAVFALFFDWNTGLFPDGQFPMPPGQGAAWALATVSSVPEPTAGCVWCLMAAGALAYRRRWSN